MKKIFTLLLGVLFYIGASAQISTFPWTEDFESESTCGTSCNTTCTLTGSMSNATTDQKDWLADVGGTGSGNTGPSADHTTGTAAGVYLYIETSSCSAGDEAYLESDTFDFTNVPTPELHFWYHLYGATQDSLHLDVNTGSGWVNDIITPWTDNVDMWQEQIVNLGAYGGSAIFQFRVRGVQGTSFTSDAGLDDFSIISLTPDNAGIVSIDNPTLPTCVLANQSVMATVKNTGSNIINSVTVNWAVNGVAQTALSYTTALGIDSSAQVSLGTYSFNAFDVLEVWTSMPNGVMDTQIGNDSSSVLLATGLVGTFTIDALLPASNTNFQSFSDAVSAMSTIGFCGPVTFNVAAGTWNESIQLPDLGNDITQPVTFNGAGQGVTTVTYDGSGSFNGTLEFNGADWVTFKNMTFSNTKTGSNAWVVRMGNASDYNTIDSCHLLGDNTSNTSSNSVFVASNSATSAFSAGNNCNYTTISNCTVEGGYYGVRYNGSFSADNYFNQVINTHIKDQYYYGVYGTYQDSLTVTNCEIESGRNTFCSGIYAFSTHNVNYQNNWIKPQETYGIYASGLTSQGGGRNTMINNMVTVDGNAAEAFYITSATDLDFFHNSAKSTAEQALYFSGTGSGVDIRNNIFVSETNRTVDLISTFAGTAFSNNLVYRTDGGTDLFENGTTPAADIAAVNAIGGVFANNVGGDPNFVDASTGDLHVTVGAGLVAGDNSVGVMTDFDGDARPLAPTTIVDIGADEIFVQNIDAAIVSFDSPLAPVTPGLQDIKVSVKNNGASPLTAVTINWAVDGVAQTPFSWTNAGLTIGNEDSDVTIGQYNIALGFTQFEVWTSAPNGGVDGDPSNDTLVYDLCTALSGTYTVGPAMTDDFTTVAAAADAVNGCGVSGPVTINIASGVYADPVYLGVINGASATNTIIFDGMNRDSVSIVHDATGNQTSTVFFDGADFVTLQNVTVENTGTLNAWAIHLMNAADNNTIQDSRVVSDATVTSSSVNAIMATGSTTSSFTQGNNCNGINILNNEIIGGYYGVRLYGEYNVSNQALLNQNNIIEGNDFIDPYFYAVSGQYQESLTVKGNTVTNFRSTGGYGVSILDAMNVAIEENFIADAGTYGIYTTDINFDFTATKRSKIVNNMVTANGSLAEALWCDGVEDTDIYHNTLKSTGEQAGYFNDILNVDIRNNIFVSETNTTVHFLDVMSATNSVDYNIYHRTSGTTATTYLIEVGTANYSDLNDWQIAAANAGVYDINSLSGDPLFQDVSIGDLHVVGGLPNDVGDNSVPVARDIDGESRPQAPSIVRDIGADEYTPLDDDATALEVIFKPGGCPTATDTVMVVVQNLGLNGITTLPITVNVTGDANASISTTASVALPFLEIDTLMVGTFNSIAGGDYNFTAYTTLAGDQNVENDTTSGTGGRFYLEGTVTDVACLGDSSGAITQLLLNSQGLEGGLTTSFTSNNGSGGNMFDVDVLKAGGLVVTGFEVNLTAGTGVDVYYKSGTYVGSENTAGDWTFVGTVPVTAAGLDQPTIVTLPSSIVLSQGTNAFFIASSSGNGWRYIGLGSAPITTAASNGDLIIYDGIGRGGNTFTASIFGPVRTFSGKIVYQGQDPIVTWSTGDTTVNLSNLVGGAYNVTVTDGVGCVNTASYTVAQPTVAPPSVTLDGSTDVTCFGAADGTIMTTTTGGTGILNYAWSNGDATANIMGLDTGSYSLVVSDANGCTDSTGAMNIMITQPDTLIATLDTITVANCNEYTISGTVTGGNGGNTYAWSGGTAGTTLTITASGTYTATVTDMNGCVNNFTANVTVPNALAVTATVTATDTAGAGVGAASVMATDGTAPYTYAWSDGQTTMEATGLTAGNYDVTVTDANGCVVTSATVTVGFPTGITGIEAFNALEMFPNPTTGMVTFNVSLKSSSDLTITIFDVAGREITNFTNSNTMMVTETFDASTLAEGVYLVRFIAGEDGVVTKRLVVGSK